MLTCTSQYVIRVNVHYMLRSDGTGNFTEESDRGSADFAAHGQTWVGNSVAADTTANGYAFAKGIVWSAIIQSQQNPQMWLPAGNTTPHPPKQISYVLGGVYFHRDDNLYNYDQTNRSPGADGPLDATLFNTYGINKGTEVNIFVLGQNTNQPDYNPLISAEESAYIVLSGAARGYGYQANNVWMKLGNVWRRRMYQKSRYNNNDPYTGLWTGGMLNHEMGHLLGLYHAYEADAYSDTPSNGVSGNNVMDNGTNQSALTPCQIEIMQQEMQAHYQSMATCGCGQVNAFFTLPAELTVYGNDGWTWLDARGSFWDNGTTSGYTVTEVDQADKPIGPVSTVSITGEPVRYKLHFAPETRYRVVLTLSNGCNSSSSTKYINTRYPIRKPAAAPTGALTLFPNPATNQFTVRSDEPLAAAPLVRDAYGRPVPAEALTAYRTADGWHTTFRLTAPRPGLYRVEVAPGTGRRTLSLSIK